MAASKPERHGGNELSGVPLAFPLGLEVHEIAPDLLPEGATARAIACGPCGPDGYKTCYFLLCNTELHICWIVSGRNSCRTPINAMVRPTPVDAGPQ